MGREVPRYVVVFVAVVVIVSDLLVEGGGFVMRNISNLIKGWCVWRMMIAILGGREFRQGCLWLEGLRGCSCNSQWETEPVSCTKVF